MQTAAASRGDSGLLSRPSAVADPLSRAEPQEKQQGGPQTTDASETREEAKGAAAVSAWPLALLGPRSGPSSPTTQCDFRQVTVPGLPLLYREGLGLGPTQVPA